MSITMICESDFYKITCYINKPERQKRSEKIKASIDDAISTNTSIVCPTSERNIDDDNSAADNGRNPLS